MEEIECEVSILLLSTYKKYRRQRWPAIMLKSLSHIFFPHIHLMQRIQKLKLQAPESTANLADAVEPSSFQPNLAPTSKRASSISFFAYFCPCIK